MPGLTLSHISKKYDDVTAVADVDLDVADGEFVALLGPSGCGKSTTLRMVAGFEAPTTGSIRIGDRLVSSGDEGIGVPSNRRDIGLVFQSYALWPHMTVGKNVGYGLRTRKVSKDELASRVREALDLVHMGDYIDRYPSELSGGQQQRVALARAVAYNPSLLLLDEPLSNLDARLRVQMRAEIRRIQAETGLTVVLVTHDQDEALEMSDEMILMRAGKIMQQGAPADVFGSPKNRFVADFLGYENFVQTVSGLVTVRPEHVEIVPGTTAPATGLALPAVVTDVAYRGVDQIITVTSRDQNGQVTLMSDVRADDAPRVAIGDDVIVTAPESRLISIEN